MAGIDHDDAIVRHMPAELRADALGPDRHGLRGQQRLVLRVPFLADALRLLDPGLTLAGAEAVGGTEDAFVILMNREAERMA